LSQLIPPKPRVTGTKRVFVLVASQFNAKYVRGLAPIAPTSYENFRLRRVSHCTESRAFEIPIVVREKARQGNVDAIVALGVILQGETAHAQHLGQVVTQDTAIKSPLNTVFP
jgi:6,7-dimethyl-8-ribityllumazine synthase